MSAAAWVEELKSGPGWTRLIERRGTQLVVVVLLIALAMDSALILTRALSQIAPPPTDTQLPQAAPARPAVNPSVELAGIINAHLFGQPGVQAGGAAPQTTMPLILAGVLADKDPAKGQAIIGDSAAAAKLVAVGSMISGGARLHAVYGDHVLLERNGHLETLSLPRAGVKGLPGPMQAPPTTRNAAAPDNATVLAGLVRVQPVFNQGKLSGYRIFPGGAHGSSAFTQLGLRAGDLILAVNGTSLDDAGRAMEVLETLSSSASATVTVSRNGQPQEVNLNLANLSTDTDTAAPENAEQAPVGITPGAQMRGRPGAMGAQSPAPAPAPAGDASPPANGGGS